MNIPQTQNREYGFYGTCTLRGQDADALWQAAVCGLISPIAPAEVVAVFLDTRHGRHFADDVVQQVEDCVATDEAVAHTAARWNQWRLGRELARGTHLPASVPYLAGLMEIIALEMEEA